MIAEDAPQDAEKAAASKKTVQCTSCHSTTAVDLKLSVSAPSTAVVSSLPEADFISITWTQAETQAAAQVFGKGQYRFLKGEDNNFTPLLFPNLAKASREPYQGHFMKVTVEGKTLLCLKSEFHPKVQLLETALFFQRIVSDSKPNVPSIITSGTAGGIWPSLDLGEYGEEGEDYLLLHRELLDCENCGWWVFHGYSDDVCTGGDGATARCATYEKVVCGVVRHYDLEKNDAPMTSLKRWLAQHPDHVAHVNPYAFERLMADCFKDLYSDAEVILVGKRSGDHGGDVKLGPLAAWMEVEALLPLSLQHLLKVGQGARIF